MKPEVLIIDYGIGNLRSVEKALETIGAAVTRTDDADRILQAPRVVLPGVGAFGACINTLRDRGLEPVVHEVIARGTPLLGVCVGMQMLFETGEEMGTHRGLGVLLGKVVRFTGLDAEGEPLKVPHMGWNVVEPAPSSALFKDLPVKPHFYFVHSYHAAPLNPADVAGWTYYGLQFPAAVQRNNVFGVQFHPEKSHDNGLAILKNFCRLTADDI